MKHLPSFCLLAGLFSSPVFSGTLSYEQCKLTAEILDNDGKMDSELLGEWMARANAGDAQAQQIVLMAVDKQVGKIVRLVAKQKGMNLSEQDLLDVSQLVILGIIKSKFNYDSSKAKFSTWAFTIARNALVLFERQRMRRPATETDLVKDPEKPLLAQFADAEVDFRHEETEAAMVGLRSALKLLIPREADIVQRHSLDLLTLKEIGDEQGVSREAIRLLHDKALGKLKERMEGIRDGSLLPLLRAIDELSYFEKHYFIGIFLDGRNAGEMAMNGTHAKEAVQAYYEAAVAKLSRHPGALPPGTAVILPHEAPLPPAVASAPEVPGPPPVRSVADLIYQPVKGGRRERIVDAVLAHMINFKDPMQPEQFAFILDVKPEEAWRGIFSNFADFKNAVGAELQRRKQNLAHNPDRRRELEVLERLDISAGTQLLGNSTRVEEWKQLRQEARREMAKRVVDYIASKGERPSSREEIARLAGMSYGKIMGLDSYAEGQATRDYALFDERAEFKAAWSVLRRQEITRLQALRLHTPQEAARLRNLLANPPLEYGDGLFSPKVRDVVLRAENWQEERPKARASSVTKLVEFMAQEGRRPRDNDETRTITGFGYEKLVGDAKYFHNLPDAHLAVFSTKKDFKDSWVSVWQAEVDRLKAKRAARGLTTAEKRRLKNLESAAPTDLPDGLKSRTPPFIADPEVRKQHLKEERTDARRKIVAFISAGGGRVPTQHLRLAEIVGVGEDKLFSKGRWAEGKARAEYGLFKGAEAFQKEWETEVGLEIDRLNLKKRTEGLSEQEEQALVYLRKARPNP